MTKTVFSQGLVLGKPSSNTRAWIYFTLTRLHGERKSEKRFERKQKSTKTAPGTRRTDMEQDKREDQL